MIPLTLPQMLRRSADMLEANNDGMKALLAVEHVLHKGPGQARRRPSPPL